MLTCQHSEFRNVRCFLVRVLFNSQAFGYGPVEELYAVLGMCKCVLDAYGGSFVTHLHPFSTHEQLEEDEDGQEELRDQ